MNYTSLTVHPLYVVWNRIATVRSGFKSWYENECDLSTQLMKFRYHMVMFECVLDMPFLPVTS